MPNYANSMLRLGFSPDDVASVSDRLFDAIIVWGDEAAVLAPGQRAPVRGRRPCVRPGADRRPQRRTRASSGDGSPPRCS